MFYVFLTRLSESWHMELCHNFIPTLPLKFQDRIRRFHQWQDIQASLVGRMLLKYGMKLSFNQVLDYECIQYTPFQKPFLPEKMGLEFNISHSGDMVVCVLSPFRVGIDIEVVNEKIDIEDFSDQMTSHEHFKIRNMKPHWDAFYRWWTRKEAVVKMLGKGLSLPLTSFDVWDKETTIRGTRVYFQVIDVGSDHKGSLATLMPISPRDLVLYNIELSQLMEEHNICKSLVP